jgi:hypothetical protein
MISAFPTTSKLACSSGGVHPQGSRKKNIKSFARRSKYPTDYSKTLLPIGNGTLTQLSWRTTPSIRITSPLTWATIRRDA